MNLELEIQYSRLNIILEVESLKKEVDNLRPFSQEIEGRVMQKLRLDWNYNSNAIEGNKLNYGETVALLMHGITAKGKPLKDHLDIQGHDQAIDFLLSIVKDSRPLLESDIRALHKVILVEPYTVQAETAEGISSKKVISIGEYKTSPNHVKTITGEIHYYSTPEETPAKMQELMDWYNEALVDDLIHPVVLAALFHYKFVAIHPFDDGNGRMARILMNLTLMKNGFPPLIIRTDDRQNYYSLLSQADVNVYEPFIEYIAERQEKSLQLYLKAANGEDIDEDEDIEKEITLLKMQLNGGMTAKEKKSKEAINRIFYEDILPVFIKVEEKSKNFNEFFFKYSITINWQYIEGGNLKRAYTSLDENMIKSYNFFEKGNLSLELRTVYGEYKNPDNPFDLNFSIFPIFDEYYYKLYLDKGLLISKLYHEKLSTNDIAKILKAVIKNLKNQLNTNQKSSE